jgi:hypothetical protein
MGREARRAGHRCAVREGRQGTGRLSRSVPFFRPSSATRAASRPSVCRSCEPSPLLATSRPGGFSVRRGVPGPDAEALSSISSPVLTPHGHCLSPKRHHHHFQSSTSAPCPSPWPSSRRRRSSARGLRRSCSARPRLPRRPSRCVSAVTLTFVWGLKRGADSRRGAVAHATTPALPPPTGHLWCADAVAGVALCRWPWPACCCSRVDPGKQPTPARCCPRPGPGARSATSCCSRGQRPG